MAYRPGDRQICNALTGDIQGFASLFGFGDDFQVNVFQAVPIYGCTMQLHGTSKHHTHALAHLDSETAYAADVAIGRAQRALDAGRLLSPGEALAVACGEARTKETLYSVARVVAFETDTDVELIEAVLNDRFPELAH